MKQDLIRGPVMLAAALMMSLLAASPAATAQDMSETIAEAAGIPNVPAFLPDRYSVPRTEALPIDGLYMVSTIKKKIRIEQGRAYAVDGWLHMFVLKVTPDMVTIQNIRRTGPGQYEMDDLPLLGPGKFVLNAEGNLDATVQGKLGVARYGLIRLEAQYPEALAHEVYAATGQQLPIQTLAPAPSSQLPGMPGSGAPQQAYPQPTYPQQPPAYQQQPTQPVYPTQPPQTYPQQPLPAPAPAPQPAPGTAPEGCTPIGVDPDTGQTICAY